MGALRGQRIYTPRCDLKWEKLRGEAVNWCKRVEGSKEDLPPKDEEDNDFINAII